MNKEININGNSGCSVSILEDIVIKSCEGKYSKRLLAQAYKQMNYVSFNDAIKVPTINSLKYIDTKSCEIIMDRVVGDNILSLILNDENELVDKTIRLAITNILDEFKHGTLGWVSIIPIKNKIESIKDVIDTTDNEYILNIKNTCLQCINVIENWCNECSENGIKVVIGNCHGDYTLSNMMLGKDSNLYLYDFLDSYIDIPLLDIIKLRQDTYYKWILTKCDELSFNEKTKVLNKLNELDVIVEETFNEIPDYRIYYKVFQIINYLRIVPYIKDKTTMSHVGNALYELYVEFSNN